MKAIDARKALQDWLNVEDDGVIGPKTRAAFDRLARADNDSEWPPSASDGRIITGEGWAFSVKVEGNDLLVLNARATCFGGADDPQDSGETASGISTKKNPDIVACSLPMNGLQFSGLSPAVHKALDGSPIPRMPWKTPVEITDLSTGKVLIAPVIDLGPNKRVGNAIDLTIAAARVFNPRATARNFEMRCNFRIRGGAQFLPV